MLLLWSSKEESSVGLDPNPYPGFGPVNHKCPNSVRGAWQLEAIPARDTFGLT